MVMDKGDRLTVVPYGMEHTLSSPPHSHIALCKQGYGFMVRLNPVCGIINFNVHVHMHTLVD